MRKIVAVSIAAALFSGTAMAQSDEIVPAAATTVADAGQGFVAQDYSFDLERTVDPSLPPLPIDAGDYEAASPTEVQTISSITFDLE